MGSPRNPQWQRPAAVTGNFNTDAAGTTDAGTAVRTATAERGSISCLWVVDVETNTATMTAGWQVSDDDSTYYTVSDIDYTASTVLFTGTGGADASVTVAMGPPDWVYGWKYVRPVTILGGTTGNTADTYSMSTVYVAANSAFE